MTTRTFSAGARRARRTASTNPSPLRRSCAAISWVWRCISSASSGFVASTDCSTRACARASIGSPPGRSRATRQCEPACSKNPPWRWGSRPARTSEDLPLPEAPTTASRRLRRSERRMSSLCPSRPKNRCVSLASKGRSPGNGFCRGVDPSGSDGSDVIVRDYAISPGRVRVSADRRSRPRGPPAPRWSRRRPFRAGRARRCRSLWRGPASSGCAASCGCR